MPTLLPPTPLASAAVVFFGHYGAVAALASQRGVHRQTLYREAHSAAAAVDGAAHRQQLHDLRQRLDDALARCAALEQQLAQAVVFDEHRLAEFAATAQAEGVPFPAAAALLRVGLRDHAPSVARLGRRAQAAGRRAAAALAVVDRFSRPRARQVAPDEIFSGRKPVLMTIEQHSLCWLGGRLANSRDGAEWAAEFRLLPNAQQVTRDGGQGLRKGLEIVNAERAAKGQTAVADQDDHFHQLQQARVALRAVRAKATRALRRAEQAQRAYDRVRRQGQRSGGLGRSAHNGWHKAEQAFDRWARQEKAWERLRAALGLFTPEGELNTRARAEAEVQAALAELTGPEWTRARRRLVVPELFTFLDRVHAQLEALPLAPGQRAQLVRCEGLRRRPGLLRGEGVAAAALRGVVLAVGAWVSLWGEAGAWAQAAVRAVLADAWRASSLVEGVNSVLRMHQRRQKRLTQGLLDLKRLHWNVHVFRAGKRKGQSPYQRLGLKLPPGSWWDLLQKDPKVLQQELSALNPAA
jgi:hypothetical protein